MTQAERDAFEMDGFRTEAACQFGFETTNDDANEYKCDEAALLAFAKACERKGVADVRAQLRGFEAKLDASLSLNSAIISGGISAIADKLDEQIAALDTELDPIREAVTERSMTAAGYVRGTDATPGKLWVKP